MTTYRTIDLDVGPIRVDDDRPLATVESPGQALTWHLRMHAWARTPYCVDTIRIMLRSMYERRDLTPDTREPAGRAALLAATLDVAETLYVSGPVGALVAGIAAASTATGEAPLLRFEDLPAAHGLVVFERPWNDLGSRDDLADMAVIRGIAWQVLPRDSGGIVDVTVDGRRLGLNLLPGDGQSAMAGLLEHGGVLLTPLYDATYYIADGDLASRGYPVGIPSPAIAVPFARTDVSDDYVQWHAIARTFNALMRMIWQRVLPRDPWRPDRAAGRRWDRQCSGDLNVSHLRRYVPRSRQGRPVGDGSPLAWTVRVVGHWRDQHYPSLGPAYLDDGTWDPTTHVRIWIDPYYRGDGPERDPKYHVTAAIR